MTNIHVGNSPLGNTFYVVPDRVGFHVSVNIGDHIEHDYIETPQLTNEAVMDIVTKLENEYVGEGKQTTADENITE